MLNCCFVVFLAYLRLKKKRQTNNNHNLIIENHPNRVMPHDVTNHMVGSSEISKLSSIC